MAIEGQVVTEERDLLLQLIRLYKKCSIEKRAAQSTITSLSEWHPETAVAVQPEREKWRERAQLRFDADFRALENALLGQKPYLGALRVLVGRHQPKRGSRR
jgi:hypothetical protein